MDIKHYHRDKDYLVSEDLFRNIFNKRINLISRFIASGKVLEIGCSTGVMLEIFKKRGWVTMGVEPSDSAIEAKGRGLTILKTTFEDAKIKENSFDLIVMNHVLEHLDSPLKILLKVNKILKKGGMLFVDVPNRGSLLSKIMGNKWPYLLPDEHKSQFTKSSLQEMLKNSGFEVIHWESRSGIFEYANPILELKRKRFLLDILTSPFALMSTLLKMGDSMSFISKKI